MLYAAVFLVVAAFTFGRALLRYDVQVVAVVTPPGLASAESIPLAPGDRACTDRVPYTRDVGQAELRLDPGNAATGPPLVITALAPGYRSTARIDGTYTAAGTATVDLQAPRRSVLGRLCVRNAGPAAVALSGTSAPRTATISQTTVDGRPNPVDMQLRLLEGRSHPLHARLGGIFDRMATLKGSLVAPWMLWVLGVGAFCAVPAVMMLAVGSALAEDEASTDERAS